MTVSTPCPDKAVLERFVIGTLLPEEAERLAAHVEQCPQCLGTLNGLNVDDTLVSTLGRPAPRMPDRLDGLAEQLIRSVAALAEAAGPPGTAPGEDSDPTLDEAARPPFEAARPGAAQAATDGSPFRAGALLGPPQGPGEIGRVACYRILRLLGSGGMGAVFEAEDVNLKRPVALKLMKAELVHQAEARQRFLREARATAAITHDHIVGIFQVGEERGVPFLVMPLLEGESLDERLRRQGRLPVAEVVRIGREIAEGLAAAHARGLIHRDIKPANIWLEDRGQGSGVRSQQREAGEQARPAASSLTPARVKIMDFGLARASEADAGLTQTGVVLGTPAYMAPEQARGDAVDARADLFSLGCVLYYACTGRPPFRAKDTLSMLLAVATQTPAEPRQLEPEVPDALSGLVLRLLSKDPAARPASARAVADALGAVASGSATRDAGVPPAGPGAGRAPAAVRGGRRPGLRLGAAAAVLFAGLLLAGTTFVLRNRHGTLTVTTAEPGVTVYVDGEEKITIDSARLGKVELTPGEHRLAIRRGQEELYADKVTLRSGGQTLVEARWEPRSPAKAAAAGPAAPAVLADRPRPFVLVRAGGTQREEFQDLDGALASLNEGDAVEVHGNGPFTLGAVTLRGKALRLKAAPGYRPQFVLSKNASAYTWFDLQEAALEVEGCDFRCGNNVRFMDGSGPSWEFRNCRLLGANVPFVSCTGPRLRFADCLIAGFTPYGNEGFGPGPGNSALEMENCIVRTAGYHALQVPDRPDDRWHVRLRRNTFLVTGGLMLALDKQRFARTTVEAEHNVFQVAGIAYRAYALRDGGWDGHSNLYVGPEALLFQPVAGRPEEQRGLAAWQKYWGKNEVAGQETDWAYFAWDEARRRGHEPEGVIDALSPVTAEAARRHRLAALGPRWDLAGPGAAYVRALAAAGRPVPREKLRPAALPGGPFVLLRGDQEVGGHATLAGAVAAAGDGDVVEIRTDDPIGRAELTGDRPRRLTLRAAPGYRPVVEGGLDFAARGLTLSVEGLHFRKGPLGAGLGGSSTELAMQNSLARLTNCSFASETAFARFVGRAPRNGVNGPLFQAAGGQPAEIVNCLIPGLVSGTLPAGGKLSVRNSVVGNLRLAHAATGAASLELERCVVWNPCGDLPAVGANAAEPDRVQAQLAVSARGTLFEGPFLNLGRGVELKEWTGAANVYRVGHRAWLTQDGKAGTIGLADWRLRWKGDADSAEADPAEYDPRQWRLLPGSPGAGAKDYGADVDRVARTSPAPRP